MYKHFGKEVIAQELGLSPEDATVHTVWLQARALCRRVVHSPVVSCALS